MLGPIDYIAVGFTENKFNGEILKELQKVVDDGLVRIIDLLFVTKDTKGDAAVLELSNMPEDVAKAFGPYAKNLTGLLTEEDAIKVAADLDNNSSAAILVFEHLWAKGFKQALINANGVLLAEGRVHPDIAEAALKEVNSKKEK